MSTTTLPTRTVGSLGPTKENRRAVSDPYKQIDASEYNEVANWVEHLATQVGTEGTPAWDSLQGRHSGDTFELWEPFIETAATIARWASAIGVPTHIVTARGGIKLTLDAVNDYNLHGYFFARGQDPYVRFRGYTTGADPAGVLVYMEDGTNQEGWGVEWTTAGTMLRGYTMTGGVKSYTNVATWTKDVEAVVEFYVLANTLYVSKDGATAVDCGAVTAGDMTFSIMSTAAGSAGEFFILRNLLIRADWSA